MHGRIEQTERGREDHMVLIVEDERVSRTALTNLLQSSGFKASAYECAEDALKQVTAGEVPEVALLDVDLPGMSGLELAERLEVISPDVVTVLITAVDGERIRNFRSKHPVHYLRKPLDFPILLELLNKAGAN